MKRILTAIGQYLAAALLVALGLSFFGCTDSVSVSEDVAVPLSSLTVTPGSLQPGFSANTTNYTVNAPTSATSVTVTARPKDNTTTMTINGVVTAPGQGLSIPLGSPGTTTTIRILLEAQNGNDTTYTVNVTRLLSSDNNLSNLTVTPGPLNPAFAPDTENYTVNVGVVVNSVSVTATLQDPNASMTINGQGTSSGQTRPIPLSPPGSSTSVGIIVTAPNGNAKTYSITVNRAALSGNNNLSALTVTPGTLVPAFAPNTTTYTVDVPNSVTSITVTAMLSDTNASMMINGQGTSSGQARDIGLGAPGLTLIEIVVTAPNGTPKTYTINVNRAAPASDNNLLDLTVTPGTLTPVFASSITTYSVNVGSTVTGIIVTATLSDTNATMTINGQGTSSGQIRDIPLGVAGSSTEVNITVIAPSSDQKIYIITVIRPLPSNSDLSALTVTPGTLVPDFVSSETTYTMNVPLTVDSVTVAATKSDPDAEMSGDVIAGVGTETGQATISLGLPFIPTTRTVNIAVRTQDGISTKHYTITINRVFF